MPDTLVRVGRWMSPEEYNKMAASGVVQGFYVVKPADRSHFKAAPPGSLFVAFDVPESGWQEELVYG